MKLAMLFALFAESSDGTVWQRHAPPGQDRESTLIIADGAGPADTARPTPTQCSARPGAKVDRRSHREIDHPPPHAASSSTGTTADSGCRKVDFYRQLRPTRRNLRALAALSPPVKPSLS